MKHRLLGTIAIASLGAALAFAVPADARSPGRGGGGGAAMGAGHVSAGGQGSAAPMARSGPSFSGARSGPSFSGGSHFNSARVSTNGNARFSARPGNTFVANNSYARANTNWSGRGDNWSWRHRHRGFGPGFGVGVVLGAAPYYYDDYAYDPYAYGDAYAYDDDAVPYETYAAVPAESNVSVQYCMQRFQSYDLSTKTYLGYDGLRHSCP